MSNRRKPRTTKGTYPGKNNAAYAGEHLTPTGGRSFVVYYLDGKAIYTMRQLTKELGRRVYPKGHYLALRCGWFWLTLTDWTDKKAENRVGPFTSSRGAYQAAIQKLDHGKG